MGGAIVKIEGGFAVLETSSWGVAQMGLKWCFDERPCTADAAV